LLTRQTASSWSASPLGKAAIGVTPDRITPAMPRLRPFDHVRLVDLDAQARPVGDLHEPILIVKNRWILDIVKQVVAFVVVNPEALLLDEGVVADAVQLQAGCQGNRP